MDFDYKKHSLEHLKEWLHDALDCEDVTPQDIYETITNAVDENIEYHKKYLTKNIEVLSLLKGNRPVDFEENYDGWDEETTSNLVCDKDDPSPECQKSWNDFWEESEQYTEEELNAMCDAAEDKEKCREYNLREAEYYDKRAQLDADYAKAKIEANSPYNDGWTKEHYQKMVDEIEAAGGYEWTPQVESPKSKHYYEYDRNDPNRKNPFKDKVTKWRLPVEVDGLTGDCYVEFPEDLLAAANLKEGDQVEWVDQADGSYLLRKV